MNLKQRLTEPMDNSPLILFRIFFGFLMTCETWGAILTGWVKETFVDVNFTFNFIGFDFLQTVVGPQIYAIYVIMGLIGLMIAFGYRYRLAIISFVILWSVTYFAQKTHYNNHYYLLVLISSLLCFVPAEKYASLDVKQGRVQQSLTSPKWAVWLLMFQVTIVYLYGAIAKLYPDWLIARPIEIWFASKQFTAPFWSADFAAQLKKIFSLHYTHLFFSYMGIIFDLLIVPFFLWNKWTRWLGLIASFVFHLTNSAIFHVGVFPYFALAFVIFFFKPETIRRRFFPKKPKLDTTTLSHSSFTLPNWFMPVFGVYFLIQILLPLRHHLIPGNVLWDESGHRLSWRMMLRTKSASTSFYVVNKNTNKRTRINVLDYVQRHQWGDLMTKPDIMWQFAQRLEKEYADKGENVSVFIDSRLSINGRKGVQFTNSKFDVASEPWHTFNRQPWVLDDNIAPLKQ